MSYSFQYTVKSFDGLAPVSLNRRYSSMCKDSDQQVNRTNTGDYESKIYI